MKMYLVKPYTNSLCQLFIYETVILLEILNFESLVKTRDGEIILADNQKLFMTSKDAAEYIKEVI